MISFKNNFASKDNYSDSNNYNNDYIQLVIKNINQNNLINILESDELQNKFGEWLNQNRNVLNTYFRKYNFNLNDERFSKQDHTVMFYDHGKTFTITMFGENTVNFVSMIGTNKIHNGVIKKNIIPKLKSLNYK